VTEIRIEELTTAIDAVDGQALLTPAVLEQIVAAVCDELTARKRAGLVRDSEMDLRSVVERQRAPMSSRGQGMSDA
jgi:hypothetical protein